MIGAGFSGFEGGLIAIALFGLLNNLPVTLGLSALILVVLIFAQYRRWIEKFDLLFIAATTLAIIIWLLPKLSAGFIRIVTPNKLSIYSIRFVPGSL